MIASIRRIAQHPFVRGSAVFQFGSVGAMLVQAVAGVMLARLLGPHDYGRLAIAMSLAAMGSVLLGAGAADAMAPILTRAHHGRDDQGVRDAMLFLGKFVLATSVIVFVLGLSMPAIANYFYNDRMIGWYGFAVLMASAVSTILLTPTQLGLQVFGRIGRLSALTFLDQTIRQACVVGFVLGGFGVLGASLGHLSGAMVVLIVSGTFWFSLRRQWPLVPSIGSLLADSPADGKKYIRPTLWVLADRNLAMLYGAAPIALAGLFLTSTDVSYFKIAFGWVTLALAVLSPISILLNTELAKIQVQQPHSFRKRFLQVTAASVVASSFVTLAAAIVAKPVFQILYGAQYASAVPLVYWLVPFGALFGLGIALGPMWRALNRVKTSILINVCVLGVGAPLALVGMHQFGALGAVGMVTVWYTASHVISLSYLVRHLNEARIATSDQTL